MGHPLHSGPILLGPIAGGLYFLTAFTLLHGRSQKQGLVRHAIHAGKSPKVGKNEQILHIFFQVFSSVFVVTIIFSPLFGKNLAKLGSRPLFLGGSFVTGVTTIMFGLLQWVEDGTTFFWLSLSIRIFSAIGESAYFSALYPLVAQVKPKNRDIMTSYF